MTNSLFKKQLLFTCFIGASAVALGALGAHFLRMKLDAGLISERQYNGYESAVRYQMFHAILMLVLSLYNKDKNIKLLNLSIALLLLGILFFSGSIYLLVLAVPSGSVFGKIIGPITPIGGLLLIIAWIILGLSFLKSK
ncbi:MAG: DUF423 domain-containing protein [Bacteroidetes bacterium]|nr:DUF423 domain-containing protein [Bacteroidota bacterium]